MALLNSNNYLQNSKWWWTTFEQSHLRHHQIELSIFIPTYSPEVMCLSSMMQFVTHYRLHNYDGPNCVINKTKKFFTIDINGKHEIVFVDHLKPAYLESDTMPPTIIPFSSIAVPTNTNNTPSSSQSLSVLHPPPNCHTCRTSCMLSWLPKPVILFTTFTGGKCCSGHTPSIFHAHY